LRNPAHLHRCKHTKRPIREKRKSESRLRTTCQSGPVYRGSPARSQRAARARRNPAVNAPVSLDQSCHCLSARSSALFFGVLGEGSQRGSQSRGGVPKEGPMNPAAARGALDRGHIWLWPSYVCPRGRRADAVVKLKPVAQLATGCRPATGFSGLRGQIGAEGGRDECEGGEERWGRGE
jgi:hypothetical protein